MTQSRYLHRTRIPTMPTFQLLSSPAPLSGWLSRRLSCSLCKSDSLISNKWLPLRYHGRCCWLCCSTTTCCHYWELPSDVRRWQICQTPSFSLLCPQHRDALAGGHYRQAGSMCASTHMMHSSFSSIVLTWLLFYHCSSITSTETQRVYMHVCSGSPPPPPQCPAFV